MQEFIEMKREGLSTQAISKLTGYDRKTVRKYLLKPETVPRYGPRLKRPSKLGPAQGVLAGPDEGRCVERPGAVAGAARPRLPGRIHDFERLAAAATSLRDGDRGSPVRNAARQTSAGGLGSLGL